MSFAQRSLPFEAFTPEVHHALAEYEAARVQYREVVRASLDGRGDGAAIRAAIAHTRAARDALARCRALEMPVEPAGQDVSSRWERVLARLATLAARISPASSR